MSTYGAEVRAEVAGLLESLANGESVQLGAFSDNGDSEATPADVQAEYLRELAPAVRGEQSYP